MTGDFSRGAALRRMTARLAVQQVPDPTGSASIAPLAALTTRETSDPAIALLDAWAGVVDIMSFYLDRIALEGYLATAEEDRSVIELARMVGYQPRPGLAGSTQLAFTVLDQPGQPGAVPVPAGLEVQSTPGPDQQPQVYETVESIVARAEWNSLASGPVIAGPVSLDDRELDFSVVTGVRPAAEVLVVGAGPNERFVGTVGRVDPNAGSEHVTLQNTLRSGATEPAADATASPGTTDPAYLASPAAFPLSARVQLFGHDAPPMPAELRQVGGLFRFDAQSAELIRIQNGLPVGPIMAITSLPGGAALPSGASSPGTDGARPLFIVAVGGAGLRRSADLGATWQDCPDPLGGRLRALCADEQGVAYAGGDEGVVLRSRDGGDSWQQLTTGSVVERRVFLRQRPGTAGLQPADFEPAALPEQVGTSVGGLPRARVYAMAAASGLLFAGTDDGVFRSTDGGLTWRLALPLAGVRSLAVAGGELVVITTRPDTLYRAPLPVADGGGVRGEYWGPGSGLRLVGAPPANRPGGVAIATDFELILSGTARLAVGLPVNGVTALAGTPTGAIIAVAAGAAIEADWPGLSAQAGQDWIDLDRVVGDVGAGGWVVLRTAGRRGAWPILGAAVVTPNDLATGGPATNQVSRVQLGAGPSLASFLGPAVRSTDVLLSGPELRLAGGAVTGDHISLASAVPALPVGRPLVVTGRRAAGSAGPGPTMPTPVAGDPASGPGPAVGEIALVAGMSDDRTVVLQAPLKERYDPGSLRVYGNVALGSHGQSVHGEVLGGGDATAAHQRFSLTHSPLTALPATTGTGDRNILSVLVDGVAWREVDSLLESGPADQVYLVRRDETGRAEVVFGDGVNGARPGTGLGNITADYRYGLGAAGNVPAESLTLLQTRPLGVQDVTNPLAATGGADAETARQARDLLGHQVAALGRLVTLSDVEHFARAFAGIANAQASMLSAAGSGLLHLTVAGVDGAPVPAGSALHSSLVAAIDARRWRGLAVTVDSFEPRWFTVAARLLVDRSRSEAAVSADASLAIRHAFGVERPGFGVPVHRGQLISVLQGVPGVVAVELGRLAFTESDEPARPVVEAVLRSDRARWVGGSARPAQLALPRVIFLTTAQVG